MIGLIYKDFIALKQQLKIFIFLGIFYLVIFFASGNSFIFSSLLSVIMPTLCVTTMAYDEKSHWDKYAATLPVSRTQIVLSKYVLGLLLSLAAFLVNYLFQALAVSQPIKEAIYLSFLIFGISTFIISVLLPFNFKLGVEKSRMVLFGIVFIPTLGAIILNKLGFPLTKETFKDLIQWLPYLLPLALALVIGISMAISVGIFKSKELN